MTVVQDYTAIGLAALVCTAIYYGTYACVATKGTPRKGQAAVVVIGACGLIGILAQYGETGFPTVAH